jgi:hypothetical protein
MLETYEATLQGDHLEWVDVRPPQADANRKLKVTVTVHDDEPQIPNGAAAVEIFKRLAAMNAFSSIEDPVAWQREQRIDRPLPGRE